VVKINAIKVREGKPQQSSWQVLVFLECLKKCINYENIPQAENPPFISF